MLFDQKLILELVHEISNNVVCATSKASDQPAHMRSLIRAFACRSNILWVFCYYWTPFEVSRPKKRLHRLIWVYKLVNMPHCWKPRVTAYILFFCMFRSSDLKERKRYVKLVDTVRETAGDVRIFSSLHVSGERMYFNIYTFLIHKNYLTKLTPSTECKIQTCRIFTFQNASQVWKKEMQL